MKHEVLVFSRGDLTLAQMIDCMNFHCVSFPDYQDYCVGDETFFGIDADGDIISYSDAFLFADDESQQVLDFAEWMMS